MEHGDVILYSRICMPQLKLLITGEQLSQETNACI